MGTKMTGLGAVNHWGSTAGNVEKGNASHHEAGPGDMAVNANVADQGDENGDQQQQGDGGQHRPFSCLEFGDTVPRVQGLSLLADKVRVEGDGAAEGTPLFAVGQLDTAMDAIHSSTSLSGVGLDFRAQAHIPQYPEEVGLQFRLPDITDKVYIQVLSVGQHAAILGSGGLGAEDEVHPLYIGGHCLRQGDPAQVGDA